ncbi:uncharacterized protein [Periplaneta americana]|uniref:uncharacterized protein n=1 Tax=Periplaneta americana TaxID=6978 RepID=UPI0037E9C436
MCCAINATGNTISPFYIFPRVNFKNFMLTGAPNGSDGSSHISGWMTGDNFLKFLDHFIKHTKCSSSQKVLLIMDNHDSHISVGSLEKATQNGIVMLTLPPHCSHRMQPLDVSVFYPFKNAYNTACNSWMLSHPGKTISIYDIASISSDAFQISFTPRNITNGFLKTGIYPFNPNIFSESDFLCSAVTDRPLDMPNNVEKPGGGTGGSCASAAVDGDGITSADAGGATPDGASGVAPAGDVADVGATPDGASGVALSGGSADPGGATPAGGDGTDTLDDKKNEHDGDYTRPGPSAVTPQDIRPYPKAPPRKTTRGGRKRATSRILTDSPVKNQLIKELKERTERKSDPARKLTF